MIKGSIVALITPFDLDNNIDYNEINRLLDFHLDCKTDGILLLGTTGEACSLSVSERVSLVKYVLDYLNGRIKVMVGIIDNVTNNVIDLANNFKDLDFDSYLVITPYYIKSNTSGLIKHFTRIADSVDKPIVLYNVPKRCGFNLDFDVVKILSYHPNIIGIKEASGDINYHIKVSSICNEDFVLYCGDDSLMFVSLCLGACGVISVINNAFGKEVKLIVDSFIKNKDISKTIFYSLLDIIEVLSLEVSPIGIKYLMYLLGFKSMNYRLPLDEPSKVLRRKLEESLSMFLEE